MLRQAACAAAISSSGWVLAAPSKRAGLLYVGAALGIAPAAWRGAAIRLQGRADRRNRLRFLGAIGTGGICGPMLLLRGLRLAATTSVVVDIPPSGGEYSTTLWRDTPLSSTAT